MSLLSLILAYQYHKQGGKGKLIYCLAAGTGVTWGDQTNVPIEVAPSSWPTRVMAYNSVQGGCVVKETVSPYRVDQGMKDCVELVLEDGRKLVCTSDHRVMTKRGEVKVEDLKDDDRVLVTAEGPRVTEELVDWWLEYDITDNAVTEHVVLDMSTRPGYYRALAFARVLGYLITDGHLSANDDRAWLYMGHQLDADSIVADIALVLGCPRSHIPIRHPRPNASVVPDEGQGAVPVGVVPGNNTFDINLPARLVRVMRYFGVPEGKKLGQGCHFPPIILKRDTPRPFLREFLGGMFGGDGGVPPLLGQTSVSAWTEVQFYTSVLHTDIDFAYEVFVDELMPLLNLFGVSGQVVDHPCQSPLSAAGTSQVIVVIPSPLTPVFAQEIGFRHCVHKMVWLSVAASWYRARDSRIQQRLRIIDAAKQARAAGPQPPSQLLRWDDVLESVTEAMRGQEVELSGVVPKVDQMREYARGKYDPAKGRGLFPSPQQFVDDIGASSFFNAGRATTGSSARVYAVPRHLTSLPVWHLGIAGIRSVGQKMTYDLCLPAPHLFIAEGIVVHNCTRTVQEMDKVVEELRRVMAFREQTILDTVKRQVHSHSTREGKEEDKGEEKGPSHHAMEVEERTAEGGVGAGGGAALPSLSVRDPRILGVCLSSRRNLCIHSEVSSFDNRNKVDALCRNLTASFIREQHAQGSGVPICEFYEGSTQ